MKFIVIALLLIPQLLLASKNVTGSENKETATKILQTIAKTKNVTADIQKTDEKKTLGTKTSYKGQLKYSNGKFFLSQEGDRKSELYYKASKVTLVEYPDQDFDKNGARKVAHVTDPNLIAVVKSLVNLFSNPAHFFEEFSIVGSEVNGDKLEMALKPKMKSLKDFKLILDTKKKTIDSINMLDDVDTETKIQFTKIDTKKVIPKSAFDYKLLPTDQEVTQ